MCLYCCHPTTIWFSQYCSMKTNTKRFRLNLLTTDILCKSLIIPNAFLDAILMERLNISLFVIKKLTYFNYGKSLLKQHKLY